MAANFGNTWWGSEWLRALSHIDYENRIPRGASYARRGAVTSLKIKGNIIEAKVAGSCRIPYKELIVLPKFDADEVAKLMQALISRPAIITALFQRRLLPDVAAIALECGLRLFPEKWNDLKMNCNCPDWAVPCKHLAAVIYMLSREIDNNPFLVFEMHGLDLIQELRNRGVEVADMTDVSPVSTKSFLSKRVNGDKDKKQSGKIDFSGLTDLSDTVLHLLPDAPPFYLRGDFKELYKTGITRVSRGVGRFISGSLKAEGLFPFDSQGCSLSQDTEIQLMLDDNLDWKIEATELGESLEMRLDALPYHLLSINPDFLPDYRESVSALYHAMYAAIHFASHQLLKPEILRVADGDYRVLWLGMESDAGVSFLMDSLEASIPEGLLYCSRKGLKRPFIPQNRAALLVSMFANRIVQSLSGIKGEDDVTRVFFQNGRYSFDGIGETEIPGAIKSWIDRLTLTCDEWQPVLYISEDGAESGEPVFSLSIGVEGLLNGKRKNIPLHTVMVSDSLQLQRFDILRSVMRLSNVIPNLDIYINCNAEAPMRLNNRQFALFLTEIVPVMRKVGLKIFMPKSIEHLLKPRLSVFMESKDWDENNSRLSLMDCFKYDWRISIGDEMVDREEFERLVANAEGLIRFKKMYFHISASDLDKLRARLNANATLRPDELLKAALSEEYEDAPIFLGQGVKYLLERIRNFNDVALPKGLNATLRPYQQRGFSWLYRNLRIGFGSILADDMGLGKTLQAIVLMLKLKQDNPANATKSLVIAPVGLLYNWQSEVKRFAPELTTHIYHGGSRELRQSREADVVITSYGMARSDADKIRKEKWNLLIVDEAQNMKNPKTAQTKMINSIDAGCRIALSGTPVENRLSEFWSIMNFANPGYLGTLKEFGKNFAKPIQVFNDISCAEELKKITSPFLMRRMKTDKSIISDLPDKTERDVYATLMPEQAALYEQTLKEAMAVIEQMPTDTNEALFKRQGIILQMILALKQICDHPTLFLKNGNCEAKLSGKAQMLIDRVQSIVEAGDKVLIFTQFKQMGDMLQEMLKQQLGREPMFFHGGCSMSERKAMVERFQNGKADKVFILSLKAAGTGLNLTAANHVIHYDLWWNPAVESQATDRAYRIGQKRNVLVDRFITVGTFEEKINEMINNKRHLADMTVAKGENWIGNLSNKELHDLFDR